MAIRKGRSETGDKLFTYVVLALIGAGVVGAGYLGYKGLGETVGMMQEIELLTEEVELKPGEAKRFKSIRVEPKGRTSMRYFLDLTPTRGEIHAGVVRPGTKLEPGNCIWNQPGEGILRVTQGKSRAIKDTISPGLFDVVVENRAQSIARTKLVLRILYEPLH